MHIRLGKVLFDFFATILLVVWSVAFTGGLFLKLNMPITSWIVGRLCYFTLVERSLSYICGIDSWYETTIERARRLRLC